jgi:hypothetical protein
MRVQQTRGLFLELCELRDRHGGAGVGLGLVCISCAAA